MRKKQYETYARGYTEFIQTYMLRYKDAWVLGFFEHRVHILSDLHVGVIVYYLLSFHYLFLLLLGYIVYLIYISIVYITYLILFSNRALYSG